MVGQRARRSAFLELVALVLSAAVLAGCVAVPADRDANAAAIAREGGLEPASAAGADFDLQIYRRASAAPGPLFVYIEGDGAAYLDAQTPSSDPTPIDPLALRLAAVDPGPAVVYVARPCQFAPGRSDRRCAIADWTVKRFSRAAVDALDDVIEREHTRSPGRPLVLVGYSGGGVLAALVAARRSDVTLLITIAAPLDIADWTRRLALSPLTGSESPLDDVPALGRVKQVDFAGGRDATVPIETIRAAIDRLPREADATLVIVPDFDHRCCWLRDWPQLRAVAWQKALPSD